MPHSSLKLLTGCIYQKKSHSSMFLNTSLSPADPVESMHSDWFHVGFPHTLMGSNNLLTL